MNRSCLQAVLATLFLTVVASAADVSAGRQSVYVLPMSGHLDLYLAEWLARGNAFQVTTNPRAAGAVLTDQLGADFERKMEDLFADRKDSSPEQQPAAHRYASGANHGTIFLIDAKTREVLWSDYEKPPRYINAASLNREAERIARKMAANFSKEK